MRGLLLKDFYMTIKYCRSFLFIIAVFLVVSFFADNWANVFLTAYPIILAAMLPATLLSYDEAEKWTAYSGTLPCTRAQLVSCKYILGLLANLTVLAVIALRLIIFSPRGTYDCLALLGAILIIGLVTQAIILPFLFKFGSQKGRIFYIGIIGLFCAVLTLFPQFSGLSGHSYGFSPQWLMLFVTAAVILLYAASWRQSIVFYQKREF